MDFTSALLSISSMILLGFSDDVLNLKWKFKLIFPAVASIPLLTIYYACHGGTQIVLPPRILSFFNLLQYKYIDLGLLYYLFMIAVCIFCTNAINILAGINGLEVGQSIVIAISMIINSSMHVFSPESYPNARQVHFLSLVLLIPFVFVSIPLYRANKYPASVFVGDTFCYFSGMTFAVVGLVGHFSKTLCLFFIPQAINFVYSVPQLFHFLDCPRHRLPKFNPSTGLLEMSCVEFLLKPKSTIKEKLGFLMIKFLSQLKLAHLEIVESDGVSGETKYRFNNLTLLNVFIFWFGPCHEQSLTTKLLSFQIFCTFIAFTIRYVLAPCLYII